MLEKSKRTFFWVVVFIFILTTHPEPSAAGTETDESACEEKAYISCSVQIEELEGKIMTPDLMKGHISLPMLGENLLRVDGCWKLEI